jgi:Holliday junction resolvase RusA-like endonuclease
MSGREPAQISREEWDWVRERVQAHDAELKALRRTLGNIQMALDDLSKWKDDSKVHEIAALKGRIKKYDKTRDRILYALTIGSLLEGVRLIVEHFAHKI